MIARMRILLAVTLTLLSIFLGRLMYLQLAQANALPSIENARWDRYTVGGEDGAEIVSRPGRDPG